MMYIYVAGPYSKGDQIQNVKKALQVCEWVIEKGHIPYCPHLSHFWHFVYHHPESFWYEQGLKWLERCDAVIRFPGESVGADAEVAKAKELGIPVYSVEDLLLGYVK